MLIRGFMASFPPLGGSDTWRCRHEHYRPWTAGKNRRSEKNTNSRTSFVAHPSFQGVTAVMEVRFSKKFDYGPPETYYRFRIAADVLPIRRSGLSAA